jgi:geranylgeranyl reductase family protein
MEFTLGNNYDVIIIGAGPAGATLAYELATRKIRALVIEKSTLPRYKCCGGGLTVKAAKLAGIKINDLADDVISGAVITLKGNHPYYGDATTPIMYTVMRENFDHALVKRAQIAGADILQGVEVHTLQINDSNVRILTTKGEYRSEFLAGADGARSQIANAVGIINHSVYKLGLTCEVQVAREDLARWRTRIGIDLGRVRGGYGWIFPKADHLSVGIACSIDRAKGLRHIFREYLSSLKFRRYIVTRWAAGLLPIMVGPPNVVRGRVILLGDAAGLADPLTGEGIFNAIMSAQLSAKSIEKALTDGEVSLNEYHNAIAAIIFPQMKEALVFSKALTQLPVKLLRVLKQDDRVWNACCRMLRGETDYYTIKKRINSLSGLLNLISNAL